jgi:hypothetical protein
MTTINRHVVTWSGATGLPGVSVFYATGGTDPTGDLVTFFGAIKSLFAPGVSWAILNSGDTIDDTTGTINGGWTGTGGNVVVSTGAGAYAAGVGCYINWSTGAIVGGRRLKGRTFLCPLLSNQYDTNGTIVNTSLATIATPATALVATGKMRIWHRPVSGVGGSSALMTAATLPDQVTSLRSRRR